MEQIVHVNIPYNLLFDQLEFILERGLNPEIYFNGEALDTYREDDVHTIHNALKKRGLKTRKRQM